MTVNEYKARRRKVEALRRYIDGNALRLGCSPAARAEAIEAMLTGWTPAHWVEAAKRAGVNEPSRKTQLTVLEGYRARIARAA